MTNTVAFPSPRDLMTIEEVAEYLRVPVASLRYWRSLGRGPKAARVGKHLRYRRAEVDRWLDEQTTQDAA